MWEVIIPSQKANGDSNWMAGRHTFKTKKKASAFMRAWSDADEAIRNDGVFVMYGIKKISK